MISSDNKLVIFCTSCYTETTSHKLWLPVTLVPKFFKDQKL